MSDSNDKKVHGHTKYQEDYPRQAFRLCLLGATDEEMAAFFLVCRDTIIRWRSEYPEFAEACHGGKMQADAEVAEALFKRAKGFKYVETKRRLVNIDGEEDGDLEEGTGTILTEEHHKHYPPDAQACRWWLNNRRSENWRDKSEVEVKDTTPVNGVTEAIQEKLDAIFDKTPSE